MKKQTYQWRLFDDANDAVVRYCSHCGNKVVFTDSGKRRCNANGKTLYEYAIYKCEMDHTWNKALRKYKASTTEAEADLPDKAIIIGCRNEDIELSRHIAAGIDEIEIVLEEVTGEWRLDKLLGEKMPDTSRSTICKMIETGIVRVDGRIVKQSLNVRKNQVITILPGAYPAETGKAPD
jgi:hypothetical protein